MANIKAATEFVKRWKTRGDEKQETQAFWIELLDKVYEDHDYMDHVRFEVAADKVEGGNNYKDVVINRNTDHAVLVEQKSSSLLLNKPEPRFGKLVTPFEQAKHYDDLSAANDKARWIVTCNFREFWIYDMYKTGKELYTPVVMLKLEDLPKHLDWLEIITTTTKKPVFIDEVEVSNEAGRLVGVMYDALKKRYADPDSDAASKNLNKLCVRLVFCLYAEDAGLFNKNNRKMFHDYLAQFDAKGMRKALVSLFRVLNQREEERDKYLADDDPLLAAFPYVNGGLFEGEIEIPPFDDEIRDILLVKESLGFDWSKISPTIFGAVFESTLNPETRRQGGMHYTSIENIHKVIDPLFLDDLKIEFGEILKAKQVNVRERRLLEFQKKMSSLRFLDPAAGSGNFLTESYLSLRKLENQIIATLQGNGVIGFGFDGDADWIKVNIHQFYGIELNDFAVAVAKTALWIAEAQMFEKTQEILSAEKDFLPLHEYNNIIEGNALRMDWNPPFVGARLMNTEQKNDLLHVFGSNWKNAGNLDYVCCWYKKAADMMYNSGISSALVSTNSIVQGENVANLWKPLFESGVQIFFAHRTFQWDSEANIKAHVHCVIIGFTYEVNNKEKCIYSGDVGVPAKHINGYLIDADDVFIESRNKPLYNVPEIGIGNKPIDGGFYLFEENEMNDFLKLEPAAKKYFKLWYGSKEFINQCPRYCLWLGDCSPAELKKMPECLKRVEMVKQYRLASPSPGTKKLAEKPTRFHVENMPSGNYIVVPEVSSQRRRYIPMGYMDDSVLCSNLVKIIQNSSLYDFGVLESNTHMGWMRAVAGRLKSDYRYSKDIVYNNFPWPNPNELQRVKIEKTAQGILDARSLYPDSSLADLYDELTMPIELRKAHEANDKAVMEAYGFRKGMTESEIVAELMKMYQIKVDELEGKNR